MKTNNAKKYVKFCGGGGIANQTNFETKVEPNVLEINLNENEMKTSLITID
jgi:hypothetical protein